MKFDIRVDSNGVAELAKIDRRAKRASIAALTKTAKVVKEAEQDEMKDVFDNPVPYTINAVGVKAAKQTDPVATVFIKVPKRMEAAPIAPQVDGGKRKEKGFERSVGIGQLVPTEYAKMTRYGNITVAQAKAIVRGKHGREFVRIHQRKGMLYPGVYERVAAKGRGVSKKTKIKEGLDTSLAWQREKKRGVYSRARGLKPIALEGRAAPVKPLLDFYGVAGRISRARFERVFWKVYSEYSRG